MPTAKRYTDMIDATLRAILPGLLQAPAGLVERGIAYPALLSDHFAPGMLDEFLLPCARQPLTPVNVTDRFGHRRPAYRGLLFHCIFRALRLANAKAESIDRWTGLLADQLAGLRWPNHPPDRIPAAVGAPLIDAVWMAFAAHDAAMSSSAQAAFETLVRCQHPQGTFLTPAPSDNPETFWYHELVLLHAATLYAADAPDPALLAAIARAAEFHQNETQPDHATSQPWALAAFARSPATEPMADQLLHAAATLAKPGDSAITSILLADALYSIARP